MQSMHLDFDVENEIGHFVVRAGDCDVLSGAQVVTRGEVAGGAVVFDAAVPLGAEDAVAAAAIGAALMALKVPARRRHEPFRRRSFRAVCHNGSPPLTLPNPRSLGSPGTNASIFSPASPPSADQ